MSTVQIITYGTLMTGEPNHRYCRNAVYIQPCTITGTLYDTGWGFPAFVPGETGTVKAELIEIPFADWSAMDQLEGPRGSTTGQPTPTTPEYGSTTAAWRLCDEQLPRAGEGHRRQRLNDEKSNL